MTQDVEGKKKLVLGPEVVQLLIPHRRPLLMVDGILAYQRGPQPVLWTKRMVSANEAVFDGHFPEMHLWPGIYTQEGMGQSTLLLQIISFLQVQWEQRGNDPEEILTGLRNLEMKYRMNPGYRVENSACLETLAKEGKPMPGMSGSVDLRFVQPVFAGQCLEFMVTLTHRVEGISRFEVEATVEGKVVAKGRMTGAVKTPFFAPLPVP